MGQRPFAIDPAGRDIHGEADALRSRGSVAAVDRRHHGLGTDRTPRPQATARRRPGVQGPLRAPAGLDRGGVPGSWINSWVGVTNMITAYGPDHRRLRKLISPAFTKRRTDARGRRVGEMAERLLDEMAGPAADEPGFPRRLRASRALRRSRGPRGRHSEALRRGHGHHRDTLNRSSPVVTRTTSTPTRLDKDHALPVRLGCPPAWLEWVPWVRTTSFSDSRPGRRPATPTVAA